MSLVALDGDRRVLDGHPGRLHLRLADAHAHPLDGELLEQSAGERRRERLEQVEAAGGDLADERRDLAVVDRVLDPVARAAVADLELDVVEEELAEPLLLLLDAVVAEHVQAVELDLHASTTALAAASASTCSRTSC